MDDLRERLKGFCRYKRAQWEPYMRMLVLEMERQQKTKRAVNNKDLLKT